MTSSTCEQSKHQYFPYKTRKDSSFTLPNCPTCAAAVTKIPQPRELFNSLHHHFLASDSHLLAAPAQPQMRTSLASSLASQSGSLQAGTLGRDEVPSETEEVQLLSVRAMAAVYHAHAGVCVCVCVCVWVCGCVGVWVCGCVGVWVCGCVGV